MAEIITMPKMSDTMTEGVVAEWLKKVGDVLKPGDGLLAEIETDKATMELDLDERMDLSDFKDCRLLYIGLEKGKAVPVDSIIAIIGENGEPFEHLLSGGTAVATVAPAVVETSVAVEAAPVASTPAVDNTQHQHPQRSFCYCYSSSSLLLADHQASSVSRGTAYYYVQEQAQFFNKQL